MYFNFRVKIPDVSGKICRKSLNNSHYIHFEYDRVYDPVKKYNLPKRAVIGKECKDDTTMMYPNPNYFKYFPDAEFPEEKDAAKRSSCLKVGMYLVIRKIIKEYGLSEMISSIIPKKAGLFLDLATYSLITENNAGQYYPDYAYNHPLFTDSMKIYSDSTVSDFLSSLTVDQSAAFLNAWNKKRDHREKIYISYDSTNKDCQAGDIEIAEYGFSKSGKGDPIVNYAIAYDRNNREPLFYEDYCGSVTDIAQLQFMLEKAKGYGYQKVGFILDRGYFCKDNIAYMDECGYDFVIMVKGKKHLVNKTVLQVKGSFENDRSKTIRKFHANGTTVKQPLYADDKKDRYFHIYYSPEKYAIERSHFEMQLEKMHKEIQKMKGRKIEFPKKYLPYFEPIYYHRGKDDESFVGASEKTEEINKKLETCGYFCLITSQKMTADQALLLYKSRDESEKLFRGDKSYLGNQSFRVHTEQSMEAKIFIEFVSLIIRSRIYVSLKEECEKNDQKANYMNVSAAIRELEKIEMIRKSDGEYVQDHAVTATQRAILQAFGMDDTDVRKQIKELNDKITNKKRGNV